jgi:CTP:molybdopterin cytidylyltransferase MocA/HD superfamily phosphohydrolase YqeK
MGRLKPLMPVPRLSALETAVSRMRESGVGDIAVVTGHHAERVGEEALRLGCRPVRNADYKTGMFSSVVAGVSSLRHDTEAFFLLPADIPLVKPATYKTLIDSFYAAPAKPGRVYPTFRGRAVHPPLLGTALVKPILTWRGEGGLRAFLALHHHEAIEIPVADRATELDMDTTEDYQRLLSYADVEFYPDEDECAELLRIAGTPENAARHARKVADAALAISRALSDFEVKTDGRLLLSACLLHDIAKGGRDHEIRGAQWLRGRGYDEVASIVEVHKDLPERETLGEAEILYLADKITDGTSVSTLEHRLARIKERFGHDGEALAGARRRIEMAMAIQKKVEAVTKTALGEITGGTDID